MIAGQSKDEILYLMAHAGNLPAIRALVEDGANLEWKDKEGYTALIKACLNVERIDVAEALIEIGADVNAYRRGHEAGAPLHHAAKADLVQTAQLLLSHGAKATMKNDDGQTALDVARKMGHIDAVHVIEDHICYFKGTLRQFSGPAFVQALAPQLSSRKIWVVVTPCETVDLVEPLRQELAIYPTSQHAQPSAVIALWNADIKEPKLYKSDPRLTIYDRTTKTRYQFASANEGNKQQLQWFYDACGGRPGRPKILGRTTVSEIEQSNSAEAVELAMALSLLEAEEEQLAMAMRASLQTTRGNGPSVSTTPSAPPVLDVASNEGSSSSCKICFEATVEGACHPCGHAVGCMSCLRNIQATTRICPICRANVSGVTRLYFS